MNNERVKKHREGEGSFDPGDGGRNIVRVTGSGSCDFFK